MLQCHFEQSEASTLATRQEDTTFRVMRLLRASPDLTQRELVEQLV